MLEPRRVAARAAAERLAEAFGEKPGGTVGYRMRGESRIGPTTRIEVVTEGILTRMIQSDPSLDGIGCVIFDEFHERSLQADLGLALVLELRAALRPDLRLLVMSATLDAAPVAALMDDAPIVTAEGRSFPVETRWLNRPWEAGAPNWHDFIRASARLILTALDETAGGILAFLPGAGEIRAVARALSGHLPADVAVQPLYGALPAARQREAIRPLGTGRKLVLATAIAETSLTIEDIRVVVDCGRARRSRFDPGSGMARLVTERVTRAEAEQRRGRAGRVAPGICYRMWMQGQEGGLASYPPPEIAAADLAGLALDLAEWGAGNADALHFLTPPPAPALAAARALLADLGGLDAGNRPTPHGRAMARVPAHPRLAHMLVAGGGHRAAELAALLEAPAPPGRGAEITARLAMADAPEDQRRATLAAIAETRRRLARHAGPDRGLSDGALLSLAYPDRIARRRPGDAPRYLMAGGKGAVLPKHDPLAGAPWLVAADLDGDRQDAVIRLAAAITRAELDALHGARMQRRHLCHWSRRDRRVIAVEQLTLGAIAVEERPGDPEPAALAAAQTEAVRDLGLAALGWTAASRRLQARAVWARAGGADLPDLADATLLTGLEDWLPAWAGPARTRDELARIDMGPVLTALLGRDGTALLDRLAPSHFTAPTGSRVPIDFGGAAPSIAIRLQEMFGLAAHPTVGQRREPLVIELLSPAGRPVQTTADLPGFWRSSYADVRKDMRGRYPRHPWPEDPLAAEPTRRAKPRHGTERS